MLKLGLFAAVGLIAVSFVAAMSFLAVSANNYAGGEAMHSLHAKLMHGQAEVEELLPRIHVGVEAAMSGVTRYVRPHYSLDVVLRLHGRWGGVCECVGGLGQ